MTHCLSGFDRRGWIVSGVTEGGKSRYGGGMEQERAENGERVLRGCSFSPLLLLESGSLNVLA